MCWMHCVHVCCICAQKNFGERRTCDECGMMFCVGDEEDEKQHRKLCQSLGGVRFTQASKCVERGQHDVGMIVEVRVFLACVCTFVCIN